MFRFGKNYRKSCLKTLELAKGFLENINEDGTITVNFIDGSAENYPFFGLCGLFYDMNLFELISDVDNININQLISEHIKEFGFKPNDYWWDSGDVEPRLKWINDKIKELS